MDITEFYDTFFEEADELLADVESHLLEIDIDNPDVEQLNAIFRAAHSIKGGAGTFGFTVLQETTHILENLLDEARKGELALTGKIVDTFLETKDMLKEQLDAYRNGTAPDQQAFEHICSVLQEIAQENDGTDQATKDDSAVESKPVETDASSQPEAVEDVADMELFNAEEHLERLSITLLNVNEKDRELLLEELKNLGSVCSAVGDEEAYDIVLEADEGPETIEAVLCFVIDSDQLKIERIGGEPEAPVVEEPPVQAPKAEEPAPPVTTEAEQATTETETATEVENDHEAVAEVSNQETAKAEAPKTPEEPTKPAEAAQSAAGKAKPKPAGESSSIRVSVDKVDQVINLVGELIITQSMLNETAGRLDGVNDSDLLNGINLLQRNARDLQDAVMSIRMLPMDYVFSRFPRLVRDLAGKLGKEIDLVTEGESTELDKGLTERIIDPLTHLVRNSLDHGIELPEVRVANGKTRTGKLVLSAQHQGGNILIEVRDDGGGLNRERILAKAAANGISVPDNASDDEVWQLIFAPGFSTAEQVSDLSGRGVGMDVVKRNIQSMGGHVEIMSKEGQGTTTRIVLPLTLAILDGMLVKVGNQVYILPVSSIVESLQLKDQSLYSLPGKVPMLKVRDEYYPLISVASAMHIDSRQEHEKLDRTIAVMVQGGNTKYVMLVDELLGQQQVVVKNLESNYRKVEGVSAATILGDGSVALILDISDLYRLGQKNRIDLKKTAENDDVIEVEADAELTVAELLDNVVALEESRKSAQEGAD